MADRELKGYRGSFYGKRLGRVLFAAALALSMPINHADAQTSRAEGGWPVAPQPPQGAPNIVLIMTDDVGFGASSTFGGPIPTPTFDYLAEHGLRYNRFNTTALCSPSRATLLTGRNPHAVGMGTVTDFANRSPGYTSVIPKTAGTISSILLQNGYGTAMFGKGHFTPEWEKVPSGPFDRWPTGLGFEYFYGFLGHDTNQFAPQLVENTRYLEPPVGDGSYILDKALADRAIAWINMQRLSAPDRPFFIYYAPGTAHAPNQAPAAWLARFRGKFDQGWDRAREQTLARQKALGIVPADTVLAKRPPGIPAWSSLSHDEQRAYARFMEAYAASLAYADFQIGRVVDHLRDINQLDNTLIVYIQGDNGGDAVGGPAGLLFEQSFSAGKDGESLSYVLDHLDDVGGPRAYNLYPAGWAWAMNTPFPWYKQVASQAGGVRNGMVISWPSHIARPGGLRSQYAFISDIFPTLLEAAGIAAPRLLNGVPQQQIDGLSLVYSFNDADAPSRRHRQIYEMLQNFGIYQDGWMAGTIPYRSAWQFGSAMRLPDPHDRRWQLFNLDADFSTAIDVAERYPAQLERLKQLFWREAGKTNIMLTSAGKTAADPMPMARNGRSRFVFRPGATPIPEQATPPIIGRSFAIEADVEVDADAQGVIVTQGGRFGGYALYLHNGRAIFFYNALLGNEYKISSEIPIAPGKHRITARFVADARRAGTGGSLTLLVDGARVAKGRIDKTLAGREISGTEGLDVGRDTATSVGEDYDIANSLFSGSVIKVTYIVE